MRSLRLVPVLLVLALAGATAPVSAVVSPASELPGVHPPNPWVGRSVLNIAHRGGAHEFPENTLFAFHEALKAGSHVLEMDLYATADGEVVVIHDATVDRTTNGSGRVDSMTLEEIQALDAAYGFANGFYRGVATGDVDPPAGYEPSDFRIPTLEEVLEAFDGIWLNIEIKSGAPETMPYHDRVAELLAAYDRTDDVIVASFVDTHLEAFKVVAPHVSTAVATGQAAVFWASAQGPLPGAPNPRYHALQVPIEFLGVEVVDDAGAFVGKAQDNGFAVHVWTINDRGTMEWLLDIGVDGIMTDRPTLLRQLLDEREVGYSASP